MKFQVFGERRVAVVWGDDIDFDFEPFEVEIDAQSKEQALELIKSTMLTSRHDSVFGARPVQSDCVLDSEV